MDTYSRKPVIRETILPISDIVTAVNSDVPLQTEFEQLAVWNATQQKYPQDACVPQLIAQQAAATPDAIALILGNQSVTYKELNQRANQVAHYLQKLGVKPNTLVGLCLERSIDMVVSLLGILKAGGAYVPFDPSYPTERLHFILEDAQVTVLITKQHLVPYLTLHGTQIICLDTEEPQLAHQSETDPPCDIVIEDLAYVIYTSGSTGQPKGVMITHRSLLNLVFWYQQAFTIAATDRTTQISSPAFDSAVVDLWPYLTIGASVYIPPDEDTRIVPTLLRNWLVKHGITITCLPTLLAESLMILEWPKVTSLRVLIAAGDILHRYPAPHLPFALFNGYGPTEATVGATIGRVFPTELAEMPPPIGRPVANTQVFILDENLRQLPSGEIGELYIGGAGLAKGYLNHPELTAERFIPHPFSNKLGERLYKTGDLARYIADGQIAFLGRNDHQVKIRGFRIELGEVEAILALHPYVQQVVVEARENDEGSKRLIAYIVTTQGHHLVIKDLRSYLNEKLPEYMVPSAFVFLDALPLTANGKIDRHALSTLEPAKYITEDTFVAPTLTMHYQLISIWEELLDIRPIGIRDNFFYLGGNSLLAAQMIDQFRQESSRKIPLAMLFAGPTIEQLVDALMREEETCSRVRLVRIQAGVSKRPFFFLHGDWTGGAFYCFPLALELGSDQPFYALEPYRFDGLPNPPTLETIAAAYIQALREVQPEGPYLLGGWCNGGLMAYEIARQLHAAGQTVDLLVLMDPMYLGYRTWLRSLRVAIDYLGSLGGLSLDKRLEWFLRLLSVCGPLRTMGDALLHLYTHLAGVRHGSVQGAVRSIVNDAIRFARWKVMPSIQSFADRSAHERVATPRAQTSHQDYGGILDWIDLGYKPPSLYPGKITFFWPGDEPWHSVSWRKVAEAQDAESYMIPGNQDTWRTKYLHILAEHLSACLSKVRSTTLSKENDATFAGSK